MSLNILITGGSGLVGGRLLQVLAAGNNNITALYRNKKQESGNVKWLPCDLSDFKIGALDTVGDPDVLVHNAASVKVGVTEEERKEIDKINIEATSLLFDWAEHRGVKKIIFTGSMSIIKKPMPALITEETETDATHHYGVSKLLAETRLLAMNDENGMKNVILRISSPVPATADLLPATVLKKWIDGAAAGKDIDVYGSGERTQDFVAVQDIAVAFATAVGNQEASGIFNIASGAPISMKALAGLIAERFGVGMRHTGSDVNDGDRWNISIEKAKKVLGFQPQYSSEETIKNLLATIV